MRMRNVCDAEISALNVDDHRHPLGVSSARILTVSVIHAFPYLSRY